MGIPPKEPGYKRALDTSAAFHIPSADKALALPGRASKASDKLRAVLVESASVSVFRALVTVKAPEPDEETVLQLPPPGCRSPVPER